MDVTHPHDASVEDATLLQVTKIAVVYGSSKGAGGAII